MNVSKSSASTPSASTPRSATPSARTQRGSGTVLVIGVLAVAMLISLAGVCIAGYLVTAHRAKAAADLAALAGARAQVQGTDVCGAVRANAQANGAQVDDCDLVGDDQDFVVRVRTKITVDAPVPGLPDEVTGVAYAGRV